ncbi:MAG: S8 family serine peptidase, partial [Planctomycetota bacterium]
MLHARHTTAHATILLLALLAVAMWLPGGPAPLSTASASDDPPAADSAPLVRVIVQFAAPAVLDLPGLVRDERAKVDFDDPLAVAHDEYLVAMHAQWIEALGRACPNAVVDWTYRRLFDGAAVRLPEEQIAALQRMDGVVGVWPQGRYEALLDRSVPAMGVDEAWKSKLIGGQKKGGEGVKVAIVDYGVYTAHEFLDPGNMRYPRGFPKGERDHCTAKVVACRSFFRADDPPKAGKEFADVRDSGSHGTHIAGIIGGSPREVDVSGKHNISGIAPAAWLMAYKILYTSEKGEASVYDGEALAALEAVVDDGADVCNNSWGHPVVFHPEREPITMAL